MATTTIEYSSLQVKVNSQGKTIVAVTTTATAIVCFKAGLVKSSFLLK